MKNIQKLIRKNIASLAPYSTARDEYKGALGVLLDANENPNDNGINRYPSTMLKEQLRSEIAAARGVDSQNLFLGNGSDEAIDLCFRVFCDPGRDNAVSIAPSYGMYGVCADINDVEFRPVQLGDDFSLPAERLLAVADEHTKLMFICSPNNPTANAFTREERVSLIEKFDGIVVLDEAYVDFSAIASLKDLVAQYSNLIGLQTMSKAYGMAGLRVGLAISNPLIINTFRQVKYPYNIGTDTIAAALEALRAFDDRQITEIISQRELLAVEFKKLGYVRKVWPSDANFLLVEFDDANAVYDLLLAGGVIVRNRSNVKGCEGCLRITVGTPVENEKMIKILAQYERS